MCWPFNSPGGFAYLEKNALIEIFFCIPQEKKPQEFKTNESILSILTIIKGEEKYLFTFIYQDLSNDFFRPLEKS